MDLFPNARFAAGFRHNMPSFGPSATVWNVSGRWDITPGLFVRGMVGTAFRLPTAEELFALDPAPPDIPNWIGNPDTKPERSTNINVAIGGSFAQNAFRWEIIGFWRDIEDLIDVMFDEALQADVFGNVPGTVEVRGMEFAGNFDFNQNLSGRLSYTFSTSEVDGVQLQRVPEAVGNFTIDYHPTTQWFGFTLAGRYVGDVYRNVFGEPVDYGNYFVADVGARVFLDTERHHRLDFNVHNVFDQDYVTLVSGAFTDAREPFVLDFRGVPRTFLFRYTYTFF
jgi:vitamin B12 transporter